MKLKTWSFNPTVLKKDITRFAPVWGLYTVFTLLFLLLMWESQRDTARFVCNAPELFLAMGMVNFFYAPLVALCLFGDLHRPRMAGFLHALPLRREDWFTTHLAAGMLFCLAPNGLAAIITASLLGKYAWVAFLWLGLMVLQYLFFFGVATFGCLCAGNPLGAAGIYGLANFLAVIIGWLVITFYEPLLYGVRLEFAHFSKYSPVVRFSGANYLNFAYDNMYSAATFQGFIPADWRYLGISAAIGAALLWVSLVIYRQRHVERAGDLIAFRPAAPVVLGIYTLCVGAVLYFIADAISESLGILFLLVGFAIGFFTGQMLLERRVKVFTGKKFLIFGISLAVFCATLGITALDPGGITRRVPDADSVKTVTICPSHYFYDYDRNSVTLYDETGIRDVIRIHEACLEDRYGEQFDRVPLCISYDLESGIQIKRYYYISRDSQTADDLEKYFSTEAAVFRGNTPDALLSNLRMLELYDYRYDVPRIAIATHSDYLDTSYYDEKYGYLDLCESYLTEDPTADPILTGLFAAISADCAAGNMAQGGYWEPGEQVASITLRYHTGFTTDYLDITIYSTCENTVAFLDTLNAE